MGKNPHEETAKAGGKQGYSGGYQSVHDTGAVSQTPGRTSAVTSTSNGKQTSTGKQTISTSQKVGFVASGIGFATGIEPLKWAGRLLGLGKKKTEKEKSEAYTKKGFDILNPNEMKSAKKTYKSYAPAENGEGGRQITFDTQALASTAVPTDTKKSGWGFQAYDSGSTANTRLYGKKGKMIKANQGEFSQGKRFGPPPKKGPDPQGIDVPLNSIDYFKNLL